MSDTVNLNASLNSRGEFKKNTCKPAVEGLWINPDYMLWLEAKLEAVKAEIIKLKARNTVLVIELSHKKAADSKLNFKQEESNG